MDHGFEKAIAQFNTILMRDIETNINYTSLLKNTVDFKSVMQYAVSDGKRLRPVIVGSLSKWQNESFMLFLEYIHTASLIIDDLPCMDNDRLRRNRPTLHVKYGEHIAHLTAYNMTFVGLKHLNDGLERIAPLYTPEDYEILGKRIRNSVYSKLGFQGLCGGQYMDLMVNKSNINLLSHREQKETILKLINMKTGDLFSLSLLLGYIGQGGSLTCLDDIEQAGRVLGLCYQIIDDLEDYPSDHCKTGGYNNICRYFTYNEIIDLFQASLNTFGKTCARLKLFTPEIKHIYQLFLEKFKEHISIIAANARKSGHP